MAITSVQRDPFARGEYLRQSESQQETQESCMWCGHRPQTLYRYAWVDDGSNRQPRWGYPFCNLRCHHAYHG
jgi:hypothetical protein